MKQWLAAILALCSVSACSGPQVLNLVAQTPGPVQHNIAYGPLPRHTLDIYSPKVMKPDTPVFGVLPWRILAIWFEGRL
jgi:hypothetical protein